MAAHPAPSRAPRRQRGAIALLFGLTLVVLLAAGGLVIDLGHLYVVKSELQNGADSGALAGSKEINMTSAGITAAAAKAIAFAGNNKFDFTSAIVLTNADISFGAGPNGPWVSVGEAAANPAGKTFIRVHTGTRTVPTYLMGVAGIANVSTSAVSVAGRFVVDIAPLGVCELASDRLGTRELTPPGADKVLLEHGFERGTTYNLLAMPNIAGPADGMLLNPVDSPPTACEASHSSVPSTAPFICQGNSTVANNATEVYANTGVSAGPVEKALNSRFDDYPGGTSCLPATAPPDSNVRAYRFDDTANGPGKYMSPLPTSQTSVLWTYSRPLRATGAAGAVVAGAPFETADWPALYPGLSVQAGHYPAGVDQSPYSQSAGAYFLAPAVNPGTARRRQINLAIINCDGVAAGPMSCKKLPLVAVGRFFLQRPAEVTGSTPGIYIEFAGLIEPVPNSEIKLYR